MCRRWYGANSAWVVPLEHVLNTAVWFFPERFGGENGLAIEAAASLLGIWDVLNAYAHGAARAKGQPDAGLWPLYLCGCRQLDVLVELALMRLARSPEGRHSRGLYRGLAAYEAAKAALRLGILARTGARLLVRAGEDGVAAAPANRVRDEFLGFRARRGLRADAASRPVGPAELAGTEEGRACRRAARLMAAAEVLYACRPACYAWALARSGRRSWRAWLLSLALDAAALRAHALAQAGLAGAVGKRGREAYNRRLAGPTRWAAEWTEQERDELARRRLLLAVYLFRSPCFDAVTGPALRRLAAALGRVPVAGTLAGRGADMLEGMQQYYSYTNVA